MAAHKGVFEQFTYLEFNCCCIAHDRQLGDRSCKVEIIREIGAGSEFLEGLPGGFIRSFLFRDHSQSYR
jgi:hypothetical protein